MLSAPLGFDKERTVVVSFSYEIRNQLPVIENQLKNYVGTQYLFATDNLLLNKTGLFQGWGVDGLFMNVVVVTPDIIPAMGIEIVEGRSFNPDELTGKALINESARKKYDLKIGDRWATYEIIGFIPDIKIFSFYKSSSTPLALLTGADRQFNMYLKLKPEVDEKEAIAYCKKTVEPFIEPFSGIVDFPVRMLDDVAEELYEKDLNQMRMLSLFCGISMFISIIGVLGLVIFELQSRRKEIAIRKINGATTSSVILFFNKTYIRIMFICFIIAVPVAWYQVQAWLDGFVYHIPVYGWVFVAAFIALLFITVIAVSLQCWRTANGNPVEYLNMNE